MVQHLGGKVSSGGIFALTELLESANMEFVNFNKPGFKKLWELEKNINIDMLRKKLRKKLELKSRIIRAVPDSEAFFASKQGFLSRLFN